MSMRRPLRYSVSPADKAPLLAMFGEGLRAGGAVVVEEPEPGEAPFRYVIVTPTGERLKLTAYLFRATKYHPGDKRERPSDEHRFQIKYGSDFTHYHFLQVPEPDDELAVTVFMGVHLEERLLIGCDPTMHNPTWFSKSVEFKDEHVRLAMERGWYGWERERLEGGRRKAKPMLDYRTETVVALTPENLLRYIDLERKSSGVDPGERLLLAEAQAPGDLHALERELGLSAREILNLIDSAFRLKVAVRGSAAQLHLQRILEEVAGVTQVVALDEDARPDYEICYRGRRKLVTIECKNVLRSHRLAGLPIVEYQKTRASKGNPICGRFYTFDHCDILAACLHPTTARWEYRFCPSKALPPNKRCPGRVHPRVPVGGDSWNAAVGQLLDELSGGA